MEKYREFINIKQKRNRNRRHFIIDQWKQTW
jgi:hypothetical protein